MLCPALQPVALDRKLALLQPWRVKLVFVRDLQFKGKKSEDKDDRIALLDEENSDSQECGSPYATGC